MAVDLSGTDSERLTWLRNAAQASEQADRKDSAIEGYQEYVQLKKQNESPIELAIAVRLASLLQGEQRIPEAAEAWASALEIEPSSAEIRANYGTALAQLGQHAQAADAYRAALAKKPDLPAVVRTNLASSLRALGRNDEADAALQAPAAAAPAGAESYDTLLDRGLQEMNAGHYDAAEAAFQRCLPLPGGNNHLVHYNLGLTYFFTRQWDKSLAAYQRSLEIHPKFSYTYHGIGNVFEVNRQYDKAMEYFKLSIDTDPLSADSYFNMGTVLQTLRRHEEAVPYLQKAGELQPEAAGAFINLGVSLKALGRTVEAVDAYSRATRGNPPYPQAFGNLASALHELGRDAEAIQVARQGVALDGNYAHGYNILGTLLRPTRGGGASAADAKRAYEIALELAPTFVDATLNLAGLHVEDETFDTALRVVSMARRLNDEDPRLYIEFFNLRRRVGEWKHWDISTRLLATMIRAQMKILPKLSLQPFQAETYPIDSRLVRDIAHHFAAYAMRRAALMLDQALGPGVRLDVSHALGWAEAAAAAGGAPERVRIGYISSDFKRHPLAYLIQNLFRIHDAERFEIFCYATTADDGSPYRSKIAAECEHFEEAWALPGGDVELALLANRHRIHILVDLNGYTAGGKAEVFSMRPAPVHVMPGVSYFGTMGGDFIDGYVSDRVGTPPDHACTFYPGGPEHCHYYEKMLYVPNSYQLNDHKQSLYSVVETGPTPRHQVEGSSPMTDDDFVYVNFNSIQKMEPHLFTAWCQIIKAVNGSVLWLLEFPPEGVPRLRERWAAHGLEANRLIFSQLTDAQSNLRRMGAADLHLDTLLFNGHTTTSDSLWAGVPVLTTPGIRHAARVAASSASQFHSVPHMAAINLEEYVHQGIALGRRKLFTRRMKLAIQEQRLDSPLFDTQRWVRDWERVLLLVWDTYLAAVGDPSKQRGAAHARLPYHIVLTP